MIFLLHFFNQFILQIHLLFIDIGIKRLPVLDVLLNVLDFSVQFVVLCLMVWDFRQVLWIFLQVSEALKFVDTTLINYLWVNAVMIDVLWVGVNIHILVIAKARHALKSTSLLHFL